MRSAESLKRTHPDLEILPAPTTEKDVKRMARQAMAELLRVRAILAQNADYTSRIKLQ